MDDIPMADASDNDSTGSRRMFMIQNVLSEHDPRSRTESSDSSASVSGYMSCGCSSDPEPEILSAKFFSSNMFSKYYPALDKAEEILPTHWSVSDRHSSLFVSPDKRLVRYLGKGESHKDASSVRGNRPIPRGCGVYYFEVKIITKSDINKSLLGIGVCNKTVPLDRLPGWDIESYGYHGDDGYFFPCCGKGKNYGPTFGSGDVVGCGINFATGKIFFTKNGEHLGYLDITLSLQTDFYPVIGMQALSEVAVANFGQDNFMFDLDHEQEQAAVVIRDNFELMKLPDEKVMWMNNAVGNWLNHVGYSKTADVFSKATNTELCSPQEIVERRFRYVRAIKEARLVLVIDEMEREFADLFKTNSELLLLLRVQKFIDRNYWSQKVINGEIPAPLQTDTRMQTRSQQHSRGSNSTPPPRSGTKRRNNSDCNNPSESSPRRSLRGSVSSENGNEAVVGAGAGVVEPTNGHCKNGYGSTTTTIVAERRGSNDDGANGDAEMEDVSDARAASDLFDVHTHDMYKYYEPTVNDARQLMAFVTEMGPISQGLHDLVMRALDMMSCKMDVLRREFADLISQDHRDKVAEAFNRCLMEHDGVATSRTPITVIMTAIQRMTPELSKYSVGGRAYADINKLVFDEDSSETDYSDVSDPDSSDEDCSDEAVEEEEDEDYIYT